MYIYVKHHCRRSLGLGPVSLIKNKNFEKQCHWVKAKWNPRVCSTGLDHGFYQNEVEKKKKKKDPILDGTLGAGVLSGLSSEGTFRVGTS